MAYDKIGGYKGGLWLVKKGESSALVWGHKNLPAEGHGYEYYWLGDTYKKAKERWENGVGAFGFDVGNVQWSDQRWTEAIRKGVSSNVTNPGGFSVADAIIYGGAGIFGAATLAPRVAAGEAAAGAGAAESAAGGAAGAEGAAGGAAGATAAKKATEAATSGFSSAALDAGILAAVTALVKTYGVRLLEVIAGGLLVMFGLVTLARGGKAPSVPVPV